jgi:hypothetical protein
MRWILSKPLAGGNAGKTNWEDENSERLGESQLGIAITATGEPMRPLRPAAA